jgi:hypothetical protein
MVLRVTRDADKEKASCRIADATPSVRNASAELDRTMRRVPAERWQ